MDTSKVRKEWRGGVWAPDLEAGPLPSPFWGWTRVRMIVHIALIVNVVLLKGGL